MYNIYMPVVECASCNKGLDRSVGRINENKKLGHNFYCSAACAATGRYRRKTLACENCGKKFERCLRDILPHNYCSSSCAATVNNQKFPKRGCGFSICRICLQKFKGENLYCSRVCSKKARERHNPQDLIRAITVASKALGRIPSKREVSKLSSPCIYAFGSWNNAVVAAGLKPNRSHDHRMYKRAMTVAADGHLCDSVSEAIIDNWLSHKGIKHERDAAYPVGKYKADWVLANGQFVEYFGLANDSARYDRDAALKQKICRQHGIALVALYPGDLYPTLKLDEKFAVWG